MPLYPYRLLFSTSLYGQGLQKTFSRLIALSHRLVDCTEQQSSLNMVASQPQALPDCIEGLCIPSNMQQRAAQPVPMIWIKIIQSQRFAAQRKADFTPFALLDIQQP